MNERLQQAVVQTLAYFDIFNYPLTKEELYRRLLNIDYTDLKLDFTDFLIQLEQQISLPGPSVRRVNSAERSRGFYFLPGREKNVDIRQLKVKLIEQKMKIARRGIRKIAWVPFVLAVFVCNTVAMGFVDEDSDIDVLIIVKKGRIWLARFLVTMVLSLFGLRRTKTKIKNRICLSFYVANNNLNLEKIAIKDDVYLIYWIDNLIPIYDPGDLHQSVLNANQWVKKYLPNGLQAYEESGKRKVERGRVGGWLKGLLEKMWSGSYGDLIEKQAKAIQQAKMRRNYQSTQNENDSRVIVSDSMLKFHEKDRRMEYKDRWLERCKSLLG